MLFHYTTKRPCISAIFLLILLSHLVNEFKLKFFISVFVFSEKSTKIVISF